MAEVNDPTIPGTSNHLYLVNKIFQKKKSKLKKISFVDYIQLMMHAFGDVAKPLEETAYLINEIVYEQIRLVLYLAADISKQMQSTKISIAEIMFLFKGNIPRLFHYMRQLSFRDSKFELPKEYDTDGSEFINLTFDDTPKRRTKHSLEFLKFIDPLFSLVTSYHNSEFDEIREDRLKYAELITRHMDLTEYKWFSFCRSASFSNKLQLFQKWFDKDLTQVNAKPDKFGWESLAYVAYETVGNIVRLAIIIKAEHFSINKEKDNQATDLLEFYFQKSCKAYRSPITPDLVNEVLRRCCSNCWQTKYNILSLSKHSNLSVKSSQLLILS